MQCNAMQCNTIQYSTIQYNTTLVLRAHSCQLLVESEAENLDEELKIYVFYSVSCIFCCCEAYILHTVLDRPLQIACTKQLFSSVHAGSAPIL